MWETRHSTVDWVCFKTQTLLETLRTQKKSNSRGGLCIFGSRTFVSVSWMCKKQTSVSHCTHTPCRTHIFLTQFLSVSYRHRAHAWLKVFAVRMPHLSTSPSPFSRFIRRPCCVRAVTSTPRSRLHFLCRTSPNPKARVKRTSARAARRLATHSTGYEPLL